MFGYSFANPLFLYGLAAVAVPILIHLLFKAKRRQVLFSSIRFILASTVRRSSRMRLKELLLLLLRIAVFALLTLAFARPFLKDRKAAALALKGRMDLAVIVDDSYSLAYQDASGRPLFNAVKQAAVEAVRKLRKGDRVALVRTGGHGALVMKLSPNLVYAAKVLEEMKPSAESCLYSEALKTANSQLAESPAEEKVIYFVSDFQRVSFDASGLEQVLAELVPGVGIEVKSVAEEHRPNFAIREVKLPEWGWTSGGSARFVVAVGNYSGAEAKNVSFTLSAAGKKVAAKAFDLDAGETKEIPVTCKFAPGESVSGTVRLDPRDRLALDDVYYFFLRAVKPISVLCVEDSLAKIRDFQETIYLYTALCPKTGADSAGGYIEAKQIESSDLTAEPLSAFDVVFLANVKGFTVEQTRRLEEYVRNGGGLVFFLGDRVEREIYNKLLYKPGGRGLLPCKLKPSNKARVYWYLKEVDTSHDIFSPFAREGAGDPSLPKIFQRFDLDYNRLEPPPGVRVLAAYDDGEPAVLERSFGKGKVILFTTRCFTTAWDPGWTDMPRRMVFLPIVHQTVRYLSGRKPEAEKTYKIGDTVILPADFLPAGGEAGEKNAPTLIGPDGKERKLSPDKKGTVVVRDLVRPGIYIASAPKQAGGKSLAFAVNLDTFESDLAPATEREMKKLSAGRGGEEAVAAASRRALIFHGAAQTSGLWRRLLVIALILMIVELVVANSVSK